MDSPTDAPAVPISEPTDFRRHANKLSRAARWLVTPSDGVTSAAGRRQARLLLALALTLTISASFGVLSVLMSTSAQRTGLASQGALVIAAAMAYIVGRTRFYAWGSVILTASIAAIPLVAFALGGNYTVTVANAALTWTLIALLLGNLLFSPTLFVLFAGFVLLSLGALPFYIQEVTFQQLFLVISLNFVTTVLMMVSRLYRDRLEADRQSQLASANQELREISQQLERHVAERTEDLELAADLGRSISQVRVLDSLLTDSVELIRSRFQLYHVQIYLTDERDDALILRAGTGAIAEQLIALRHRLPIRPDSINGLAAMNKQAVVVPATIDSPLFRPNDLLPNTRSEMAVPLMVGDRVVGVLDLQSSRPHDLSADRIPAFEALAGQLAVAVENARLFAEIVSARADLEAQATRLTGEHWREFLDAINRREWLGFTHDGATTSLLTKPATALDGAARLAIPISLRGQQIGSIHLDGDPDQTEDGLDADLVSAVARQVAEQVENLRLLAEAEQYRHEAEEATRRLIREGWQSYHASVSPNMQGYVYDQNEVAPLTTMNVVDEEDGGIRQPLTTGDETIGYLHVSDVDNRDDFVGDLITTVSERLSAHIENLRLSEQTEQQLTDLAALQETTSTMTAVHSFDEAISELLPRIAEAVAANSASLMLVEGNQRVRCVGIYPGGDDGSNEQIGELISPQTYALVRQAIETGKPMAMSADDPKLPSDLRQILQASETASTAQIPLISRDEVFGLLTISLRQSGRLFTDHDLSLLQTLADQAMIAVQRVRLLESTRRKARHEQLLREVTARVSRSADVDTVMRTAVEEIGRALGRRAFVYLDTRQSSSARGAKNGAQHERH